MTAVVKTTGFRAMQESDLFNVLTIENASYDFPWSEGIFQDCLHNQYLATLFVQKNRIMAYSVAQLVLDECHLLNLCVRSDCRGKGLGEKMVRYLLSQISKHNVESVFLEVRVSNAVALNLYEKLGFNEIGLRRGYYPDKNGREDALVLAYEIL